LHLKTLLKKEILEDQSVDMRLTYTNYGEWRDGGLLLLECFLQKETTCNISLSKVLHNSERRQTLLESLAVKRIQPVLEGYFNWMADYALHHAIEVHVRSKFWKILVFQFCLSASPCFELIENQ